MDGQTDVGVHRLPFQKVLTLMREHKLYANLKKCIFAKYHFLVAPWVSMASGPIRNRLTGRCLQMSRDFNIPWPSGVFAQIFTNYAEMTVHLSRLLKKNEKWEWSADCQRSFEGIKQRLIRSPVLAIADRDRPFHVVCNASDFAIGCALMQYDADHAERVACY